MASGDTLVVFTPQQNEPPATNPATFDTRNGYLILDFDDTTDEEAIFKGVMPRNYGGGGITITIGWMASDPTVTPHNAMWQAAIMSISDDADDLDTKAFAAFNDSGASQEPSASGEVKYTTIAFTDGADMDSVAAGEVFYLKIRRDADNASDNLTGDTELLFIEIKET